MTLRHKQTGYSITIISQDKQKKRLHGDSSTSYWSENMHWICKNLLQFLFLSWSLRFTFALKLTDFLLWRALTAPSITAIWKLQYCHVHFLKL